MVAAARKFLSALFGNDAVAPPARPAIPPPVPVEDHAGGRYFARSPAGHYVIEALGAPGAAAPVGPTTARNVGELTLSPIPEDHDRTTPPDAKRQPR